MPDDDVHEPPSRGRAIERVDLVAVVAGLVFIAIALAALTDRYWAEVDAALMFGGAIVAVGVTMIVGTVRRHSRRDETPGREPERNR